MHLFVFLPFFVEYAQKWRYIYLPYNFQRCDFTQHVDNFGLCQQVILPYFHYAWTETYLLAFRQNIDTVIRLPWPRIRCREQYFDDFRIVYVNLSIDKAENLSIYWPRKCRLHDNNFLAILWFHFLFTYSYCHITMSRKSRWQNSF